MGWNPGQLVRHIFNPAKIGTVTNKTRMRTSGLQYCVNWNGRLDWHYEDQLVAADAVGDDPLELIREGRYGRVEDLRRLLTHVHLAGRLANVVYAMGLTQTDFYPHQYKPLLTLLDSPVNGLLIADEVGLGKTIEAGLIWTELRARYDMRRLLVVCPAMLREKWRLELSSRFGLDARVVDAATLLQEIESTERMERAWIVSYQGIRVPGNWKFTESDTPRRSVRARLADLLYRHAYREPLFDLVIFDEAHYMRNQETGTWRTGELLREVSAHQVMLSATPINLGSDDLFNLLRLLDPDHFERKDDFMNVIQANKPVIAASDIVRDPTSDAENIVEAIQKIKTSRYFGTSERVDRLIEEAEAIEKWTHGKRVEFAAKIERLNLIAHVVTRTRKRDVQTEQKVIRDVTVFEVEMAPVEADLYRAITEGTREYAQENGIEHGFLLSTPQRMVASSPVALLRAWRDGAVDADALAVSSDEADEDEDRMADASSGLRRYLAGRVLREFDPGKLARQDSKFAKLKESLKKFLAEDREDKAVVFTTFRGTARYLVDRLSADGIEAGLLMGGAEFDKETVVNAFREDRSCRVLVCTDVAAEGVDLQFCRLVVNYDLPWNPMRIEQRIGRIDRIGQRASRILIWNFVHKNTIDALILSRLAERIGVFESTLGETGEILGKVRQLEDVLLSKHLTPAEEAILIEQVALAIENIKRKQEELEREAVHLVAHGQQLLTQIEAARGGRTVTRQDLIRYVDGHLSSFPGCRFIATPGQKDTFEIQLSPALAAELEGFLRRENLVGKTGLWTGQIRRCRFTDKITEKPKPGEEIIHRFHPIIRFLSRKAEDDENRFPLYAAKCPAGAIPAGRYVLMAKVASFTGVKEEEHLLVSAVSLDNGWICDDRTADALLDSVRQSNSGWSSVAVEVDPDAAVAAAERCEEKMRDRFKALRDEKQRENRDRAELLLQLLDDHVCKKREGFEKRIADHEAYASLRANKPDGRKRKGLANAERKRLENFLARMETRRATIVRKSESFSAESRDICVLLVDVMRNGVES